MAAIIRCKDCNKFHLPGQCYERLRQALDGPPTPPPPPRKPLAASTRYRRIKVGQLVRLNSQLETKGGRIFAEGLVMRVTGKHGGLALTTINDKPCPACGLGERREINHVRIHDVTEVDA